VLLSGLGQGTGAVVMSYAACLVDNKLGELYLDDMGRPFYQYNGKIVKRVSMVHDEYSFEVEAGIEDEVVALAENGIKQAGIILKLALPLDAEGKWSYEGSWRDVH
jgi:DNA polymerase I-like protein with 3'-5' exonuclease and polymerase domains